MNEAQTRHDLIDPALRDAGWNVVPGSEIKLEWPITAATKPGVRRYTQLSADYVLRYRNRPLAVIEAKKRDLSYRDGTAQAIDYGQRLRIRHVYSTNGRGIYHVDLDDPSTQGTVDRYPTPQELWAMTYPDPLAETEREIAAWKERFAAVPFETAGGKYQPRYYQANAIDAVLNAIAEQRDRILLTLATGTGKTPIAFQLAWKLFETKWNLRREPTRRPRILFLADRNVLADQAFNKFSAFTLQHGEKSMTRITPADIAKRGSVPTNSSIFFSIFQTFMSGPDGAPYFGEYDKDFFDFIIIDECHRGGANDESSWRGILEHFAPAVQLGLTATPKRKDNVDTYAYFGEPVYEYSLHSGIEDGFLTPFRVREYTTSLDKYIYTGDDEIVAGEVEEGKEYGEADFNRKLVMEAREKYRVELFLKAIDQRQKSLVFCATQSHAALVRDLINKLSDSLHADYCQRVTADDGSRGEDALKAFQDDERTIPTILTTSQKLSTGVDASEVRHVVLLRPVNSMVEFKQIIGRGTRLHVGKDYFTIHDFVEAYQHFQDPEWDGPPLDRTTKRAYTAPEEEHGADAQEPGDDQLTLCPECDNHPCVCERTARQMTEIRLSPQKVVHIDSMVRTMFYDFSGRVISAPEFLRQLFGDLSQLLQNEGQLREQWSRPDTRRKLLQSLAEAGYTDEQLQDLRRLVKAESSDLFDVLRYVAYSKEVLPRLERATRARAYLGDYDAHQQEFLNFVLDQYVQSGHEQLDDRHLGSLLVLKYHSVPDAKRVLGDPGMIRQAFIDLQGGLYRESA